ncbi:hypothetical protein Tco_1497322, partial [Tanacetum coccineum]
LLKNLKDKFQLVATQFGKLGISPPPELTAFDLPLAEKKAGMKRKRRAEAIHEVFFKEDIMVDGMYRILQGLENEFHLATTPQLIRIQNAINVNSESAQDMYNKMIYVIEAREDVVEARKIDSLSAKPKRATSDVFKSETSSKKSKITDVSLCVDLLTASNDKLIKSRINILWGMFKRENVDYPELIWEDIAYQIDHRKEKRSRRENIPYLLGFLI